MNNLPVRTISEKAMSMDFHSASFDVNLPSDPHANGAVPSFKDLGRDVKGGSRMNVLPIAVLFGRVHVHLVLHGNPRGSIQPVDSFGALNTRTKLHVTSHENAPLRWHVDGTGLYLKCLRHLSITNVEAQSHQEQQGRHIVNPPRFRGPQSIRTGSNPDPMTQPVQPQVVCH